MLILQHWAKLVEEACWSWRNVWPTTSVLGFVLHLLENGTASKWGLWVMTWELWLGKMLMTLASLPVLCSALQHLFGCLFHDKDCLIFCVMKDLEVSGTFCLMVDPCRRWFTLPKDKGKEIAFLSFVLM